MGKLVFLSSSPAVECGLVQSVAEQHSVDLASVHIVSNSGCITRNQLSGTYDIAISIADSPEFHNSDYLTAIAKALHPGATIQLQQPAAAGANPAEKLKHALVLSGFVDVQPVGSVPGLVLLRASLPKWQMGTKAALPLKSKQHQATAVEPGTTAKKTWALDAGDDEELVDDDELLTEDDLSRPAPAAKKEDDCEVGAAGRKACKNCSCGRADAEAKGQKVQLTQEMLDNPQSSCGNCSLGDAFRCASCPYKGLPAFEPGKKIQLPSNFLVADV